MGHPLGITRCLEVPERCHPCELPQVRSSDPEIRYCAFSRPNHPSYFLFADDPLRVFAGHVEDGAFVELTASSGLART